MSSEAASVCEELGISPASLRHKDSQGEEGKIVATSCL